MSSRHENSEIEKELGEEEVVANISCSTVLKKECLTDCIDGTAWLSTAN